jgi:hypothetical protein
MSLAKVSLGGNREIIPAHGDFVKRHPGCEQEYLKAFFMVYILIHTGKGGRGRFEPEIRLEGQNFIKLGRKYQHI